MSTSSLHRSSYDTARASTLNCPRTSLHRSATSFCSTSTTSSALAPPAADMDWVRDAMIREAGYELRYLRTDFISFETSTATCAGGPTDGQFPDSLVRQAIPRHSRCAVGPATSRPTIKQ